jgi:hypothetical protein
MLAAMASRYRKARRTIAQDGVDLLERSAADDREAAFKLLAESGQQDPRLRIRVNGVRPLGEFKQSAIEIEEECGAREKGDRWCC